MKRLGWTIWSPRGRDHQFDERAAACIDKVGLAAKAHVPATDLSYGELRQLELKHGSELETLLHLDDEAAEGGADAGADGDNEGESEAST